MSLRYRGLVGRKVDLLHRPLVGVGGVRHPVGLLIVEREVLHGRGYVLALDSLDLRGAGLPGQVGVFAGVLEVAAAERRARYVYAGCELDVDPLVPGLPADRRADAA